ncbi:MAG: mucin desulfatase [Fimbriimonadales bacterium]|nr:MAG: mucin desulfatase [Fimbriimonadales bacterium]
MSNTISQNALFDVAARFQIGGTLDRVEPFGSGHINDTFLVQSVGEGVQLSVLQRINPMVFPDAARVMRNVRLITESLSNVPMGEGRECLRLIPTTSGGYSFEDADGATWRMYHFVESSVSHDTAASPSVAREAARAFGVFQRTLMDFDAGQLVETLRDFHNTPARYRQLLDAAQRNPLGRLAQCLDEFNFIRARSESLDCLVRLQEKGAAPVRVTHNDTKINNVLLDMVTGAWKCVIDLDTVMPGLSLYDFGDLVRTATATAPEDETDLTKMDVDLSLFEAVAMGYVEEVGVRLTPAEQEYLVESGRIITLETAMRFLADYLNGDVYFRVHRPNHNLERCRAQLALVERIEERRGELQRIVESALHDSRRSR